MAFDATYSGLCTVLGEWLDGAVGATSRPGEMISLAEAYFRREILHHDREGTTTLTAASSIALPSDFLSVRSIYLDADPKQKLNQVSPSVLNTHWAFDTTGRPMEYAIEGQYILLGPSPDSAYSLKMTYQREFTPLSSTNATNWLIEDHYDLYLYGAMMHSEVFAANDDRAANLANIVDGLIQSVNNQGARKRIGGTIRIGCRVNE